MVSEQVNLNHERHSYGKIEKSTKSLHPIVGEGKVGKYSVAAGQWSLIPPMSPLYHAEMLMFTVQDVLTPTKWQKYQTRICIALLCGS